MSLMVEAREIMIKLGYARHVTNITKVKVDIQKVFNDLKKGAGHEQR